MRKNGLYSLYKYVNPLNNTSDGELTIADGLGVLKLFVKIGLRPYSDGLR